MQIEFRRQQIGQVTGLDGCGDRHHTRLENFLEDDLVFPLAVLFRLVFVACDLDFDLSPIDGTVVIEAIQIKRDQLSVDDADQFKILGCRSKTGQRGPCGLRCGVSMVVTRSC